MVNKKSIVKMIEIIPMLMKSLIGDFKPQLPLKLDRNEYRTLLHVYKFPHQTMGFYCNYIQIESGSFTYVTDKLVEKKLIQRAKDTVDKRQTVLKLTPRGKDYAIEIKKQFEKNLENKLNVLDRQEWETLEQATLLLEKINNSINK